MTVPSTALLARRQVVFRRAAPLLLAGFAITWLLREIPLCSAGHRRAGEEVITDDDGAISSALVF